MRGFFSEVWPLYTVGLLKKLEVRNNSFPIRINYITGQTWLITAAWAQCVLRQIYIKFNISTMEYYLAVLRL